MTKTKKTNVGDVSPVFEVDDQFVVAVLTGVGERQPASTMCGKS